VVFFGTPAFAVPTLRRLLESHHPVVGVVTQPDRPRGRGQHVSDAPVKTLAVERSLPVLQPERLRDVAFMETVRAWAPDLGVVAAYGKLLPEPLLRLPHLGMINVHASLLPRYRGAAPVHRAVMNGDSETGVTIMRIERELDAGPMFARVVRPISPTATSQEVERDLAEAGAALLVAVVDAMATGTAREEPQDHALATYAPKITRDDGPIDWTRTAAEIHNQVRGLYPWPHASTQLAGERLIVLQTRVEPGTPTTVPGTVITVARDALHVATGNGCLVITRVQPEGRRPMTVRDFLAGRRLQPGMQLGRT
jgi:methionyl-tRNA formyltransferase